MKNKSCNIIWLLGVSGAGKTTLGRMLQECLSSIGRKVYLIDGDEMRSFYDNDLGYSREERMENIKRIMFSAYTLSCSGVDVIVCNISPFQILRDFARRKLPEYNEIYLKRDLKDVMQHDVKGVYKTQQGNTHIVGVDLPFEEPVASDLTLDTSATTPQQALDMLWSFLKNKYPGDYAGH